MTGRLRAPLPHPRASEYVRPGGPWDGPSLPGLLGPAARNAGARVLLVDDAVALTGAELEDRVARLATGLARRGVGPGTVVAWQCPNRHEAVLLLRACWALGAVAAPLHHQAGMAEVRRATAALAPVLSVAAPGVPLAGDPAAVGLDSPDWERLLVAPAPLPDPPAPDALAAVLFTSGSSGRPKGVLHSHRTLGFKARQMPAVHGLGPDDVVLMPAPLAHVSGLLNGVAVPGAVPFRSVLMARWDPEAALGLIEEHGVTFMVGPPTFFTGLMAAPGFRAERVASLRLVSSGGAGVTVAFVEEAATRLGCVVRRTYGSTEAPTVATSHPERGGPAPHDCRPIGAVELRVAEAGEDGTGELRVRGPEVCCGYLDAEDTRAAFTPDGWYRTGDRARLEEDGRLVILGRLDDVVIRGGENVSTAEVEAVLERHPAVTQAVAVGYPDPALGERVCAFVVAPGGFDLAACREWFAAEGVARFKTPERVVVRKRLPLLATGKPDREALRAEAARD